MPCKTGFWISLSSSRTEWTMMDITLSDKFPYRSKICFRHEYVFHSQKLDTCNALKNCNFPHFHSSQWEDGVNYVWPIRGLTLGRQSSEWSHSHRCQTLRLVTCYSRCRTDQLQNGSLIRFREIWPAWYWPIRGENWDSLTNQRAGTGSLVSAPLWHDPR